MMKTFAPLLHSYWYLFRGAGMTVLMATAAVVPATLLGVVLALAQLFGNRVTRSAVMGVVLRTAEKAAASAIPVLIGMGDQGGVCSALEVLTHYQWCRTNPAEWRPWWIAHSTGLKIYGTDNCPAFRAALPARPR